MVIVIFIVATLTFILAHAIPGGPFTKEKALPDEVLRNIEARYKLDQPLYKQYFSFIGNMLKFDFGPSFRYEALSVNDIIRLGFPISSLLGFIAVLLALGLGLLAGSISALHQNMWQDNLVMVLSLIGVSIPSFILATFLMYFLGLRLGLFRLLVGVIYAAYSTKYNTCCLSNGFYCKNNAVKYARSSKAGLY